MKPTHAAFISGNARSFSGGGLRSAIDTPRTIPTYKSQITNAATNSLKTVGLRCMPSQMMRAMEEGADAATVADIAPIVVAQARHGNQFNDERSITAMSGNRR
jgi:hypothetical protein